jgi:uncharacterized membrane protein HdeD (DUF308 family)
MRIASSPGLRLATGIVMIGLGLILLVRIYVMKLEPKVGSQGIATVFSVFFILRGLLYLKSAKRAREMLAARPDSDA